MFCTECGGKLSGTATYCTKCGREAQSPPSSPPSLDVIVEVPISESTPPPTSAKALPAGWTSKWKATCPNGQCGRTWSYNNFTCPHCYNQSSIYAYQNDDLYNVADESPYADDYVEGVLRLSPQLELRCTRCGASSIGTKCPVDGCDAPIFGRNLQACFNMPGPIASFFMHTVELLIAIPLYFGTFGLIMFIESRANVLIHRFAWKFTPKRPKWYPFIHPELRPRYLKKR